jgi:enamine deaminase RidA (YjgF/YER057c/UK114 family)
MARRPDLDTGQMEKASRLMADIVSKFDMLARFDEIKFGKLGEELDSIDQRFDRITKTISIFSKKGGKAFAEYAKHVKDLNKEVKDLDKQIQHKHELEKRGLKLTKREQIELDILIQKHAILKKQYEEEIKIREKLKKIAISSVAGGLDFLGGSVLSLGFSTVFAGLKLLATGIEKVYDLQEKWTHAIGTFRRSIGPATEGSRAFERTASQMHFTLMELGMGFEAAHQEMTNFVKGFGFADAEANNWSKSAVEMGIATGAGTDTIAELARNFKLMGGEVQGQKAYFADFIAGANAAGVSVAEFTRELAGSKESLAEFGEMGQRMFIRTASWARRLGVSIKSLQNIVKLTDTFSSTAEAAAKMNTVFGTSINSMDLMLEQDPAKRFNMLRDALIGVGKDMANLGRLEKRLIAETLGLSMEETNAFLKTGKDYNKFIADKQKSEERAARATANMNKMMTAAATTLMSWEALAEKVIRKFQPFIQVFLEGMGVAFGDVGTGAHKLGDVILKMTDQVVAALEPFKGRIKEMGGTITRLFKDVFTKENIERVVHGLGSMFSMFGNFMEWTAKIAASPMFKAVTWLFEKLAEYGHVIAGAWAGAKVGGAIGSIAPGLGTVAGAIGGAVIGGTTAYAHGAVAEMEAEARAKGNTRATGGSVSARSPYIVGEEGPEVMVPGSNGTIIPNHGGLIAAPVQLSLKIMLDSREIQRIPFNTTLPINVSVAGG